MIIDWLTDNNREYAQYRIINLNQSFHVDDLDYMKFLLKKRQQGINEIVEVIGNIDFGFKGFQEIPCHFGKIFEHSNFATYGQNRMYGDFHIEDNELKSLNGAPYATHHFICSRNQLSDLEGSPVIVQGKLDCSHNQLISLKGSHVVDSLICYDNKLKNLLYLPIAREIHMRVLMTSFSFFGSQSKYIYSGVDLLKYKKLNHMNVSDEDFFQPFYYEYWHHFQQQERIWHEEREILNGLNLNDDKKILVKI